MEPDLAAQLSALQQKVDAMYTSVEKLRKYFLWTGIISVALFVLPLIGLIFAIPAFLNTYSQIDSIGSGNSADFLLQ
jgi:hypothetical protein